MRTATKDKYPLEYVIPKKLLRYLYEKTKPDDTRDKEHKGFVHYTHRLVRYLASYFCKPFLGFQDGATYTSKSWTGLSSEDIEARHPNYERISEILRETDTRLDNQVILDISGGPGWLPYHIENDKAIRDKPTVTTTEFQESTCRALEEATGYEFVKFDYQKDRIHNIFKEKTVDIIFINMSLGFCPDISTFFSDAKKLLRDSESRIVIDYPTPSLADCTLWLNQEYTFLTLYSSSVMNQTLDAIGFSLLREQHLAGAHFSESTTIFLDRWVARYYQLRNMIRSRKTNRDLYCRGTLAVYRNS